MAVVRAPSMSLPAASKEWGFYCEGCRDQTRSRPLHWRRKYTVETFKDHILQHGHIVDGVHCPQEGSLVER